ncbi:hypothetical protein GCM10027275_50570 [Rhabdobacter roseus]|uniref:Major capsid protein n=1 Tax=Rhabdobacter roseus TaxID=1655419 RepID=A0A840U4W6_9BACT|nr:hypothetical protein [Rhabdobacter roseus]MBB5287130.1 hypothetical protein [Rhabdobacter roseus]
MPAVINFENFHEDLMRTIDGNGAILQEAVVHGASSLGTDFTVLKTRDRAALVRMDVKDAWRPAGDDFSPKEALDVKTRYASFKEADIDLEIKLSDIKEAYQTYLGWLKTPGRTLQDVNANPFELFFLNHIVARHFEFVRLNTAWNGVYNGAGAGSGAIADGFIAMFTTGRGVGGDIASSHVFDGTALTASNAYAQFNGVANLVASQRPKMLNQELNVYCSLSAYDKYRHNRRTLFAEHVGPADRPAVLDDYSNMKFVVDPGLAGKDTIVVTPKKNLLFVANEDPNVYSINIVKAIKSWQITIRTSLGFDYATPDWLFLNDVV